MDDDKGSNDNISFSALLKNPDRDYAYGLISQCVGGMEMQDIPRDIIVRGLFTFCLAQLGRQALPDASKDYIERFCLLQEMHSRLSELVQQWNDIVASDNDAPSAKPSA